MTLPFSKRLGVELVLWFYALIMACITSFVFGLGMWHLYIALSLAAMLRISGAVRTKRIEETHAVFNQKCRGLTSAEAYPVLKELLVVDARRLVNSFIAVSSEMKRSPRRIGVVRKEYAELRSAKEVFHGRLKAGRRLCNQLSTNPNDYLDSHTEWDNPEYSYSQAELLGEPVEFKKPARRYKLHWLRPVRIK